MATESGPVLKMKAKISPDPDIPGASWLRVMPNPAKGMEIAAWHLLPPAGETFEGKPLWRVLEVMHTVDPCLTGIGTLFAKVLQKNGCGAVAFQGELVSEAFMASAGLEVKKVTRAPASVASISPELAETPVFIATFKA